MDKVAYEAGFINGIWAAAERLVLEWCIDPAAKKLLLDSKVSEAEARQVAEGKPYTPEEREIINTFLDETYTKGAQQIFSDKENAGD